MSELSLRLTGPWQRDLDFRRRLTGDLAAPEKVPGRWRPDDALLSFAMPGPAAFFSATLEPE